MEPTDAAIGLVWYAAFVLSTTAHEAAHSLAALLGGDPTAYQGGQVSLNPIPHMRREPFGMVLVPLLSALSQGWCIGWASTPYDPRWERRYPRRAAWMAAAGPAANVAIALGALVALRVGLETGVFQAPERVSFSALVATDAGLVAAACATFLSILLVLNAILALFNLIPFPPLDGASAVRLLLSDDAGLRLQAIFRTPPWSYAGLLAAWFGFGKIVPWLFGAILGVVHPDMVYR